MKKLLVILASFALAATLVAGAVPVLNGSPSASADSLTFEAKFETAGDFYNRFDYALSGQSPAGRDDPNVAGAGGVFPAHGDHNMNCGDPTTSRDVSIHGEQWDNGNHFPNITFDELFWFCAPGNDPAKGHMMTGFTTQGYNHLWFSPKQEFTNITKVCWDQNMNTIGGKWLEVQFVDHADATRYPTGSHPADSVVARGTGGFDLGYTEPGFRPEEPGIGPNNGLMPRSGNLAGLHVGVGGTIFDWWQNQNDVLAAQVGWPGMLPAQGGNPSYEQSPALQDKAARYQHCIENLPNNQIKISFVTPEFPTRGWVQGGTQTYIVPGQIPQDSRRVVFHDAEYDGPKRGDYNSQNITWHWDNIQVFTTNGAPTSTTTVAPSTTASTTTTTVAPSTTTTTVVPSTTTTTPSTTTTVAPSTTTTVPASTTTTLVRPLSCNAFSSSNQRAWCNQVNSRLAAIEQRLATLEGK